MSKFTHDLKNNMEELQLQVSKEEHLNNNSQVKNYARAWI